MRRLISLTNIPTTYRVHFYNSLDPLLANRGIRLEVFFMGKTEPGRHWTFNQDEWQFQYRFAAQLVPVVSQHIFYFNPAYILGLAARPPDWLLMAGSWFFPTVVLSSSVAKLRQTKTLFWSESNLAYVKHRDGIVEKARKWVMDGFDGFVVPGQWAEEYVRAYAPSARQKPMLTLPNVVDEYKFRVGVTERRKTRSDLISKWNLDTSPRPILLTAARLEPIKGVKELLLALCLSSLHERMTLLVAGEGSLRQELEAMVERADAGNTIRFLGHLDESQVLDLLAVADGFILPSLGDSYPLAAIEACFAQLPLLLSNRVGCHPEALIPGENGWLFDPYDTVDIESCLNRFLDAGSASWTAMGAVSLQLAEERFSTHRVLTNFVDQLVAL